MFSFQFQNGYKELSSYLYKWKEETVLSQNICSISYTPPPPPFVSNQQLNEMKSFTQNMVK